MSIEDEFSRFNGDCSLLSKFISDLAKIPSDKITSADHFLAEAVTFRLYRAYERLIRAVFLDFCITSTTAQGRPVKSKLTCDDWDTAEEILKAGNKFLDWGNVQSVRKISNLVFEQGFPLVDVVGPIASTLIDLHRFRNFIAHSSKEAESGFKKAVPQYVTVGSDAPVSVGELAIYRRSARADITLRIVHDKVSALPTIYGGL